jgi:hypothetical protein
MAKKKKKRKSTTKRDREIHAATQLGKKLFLEMPAAAHSGPAYCRVLITCGVPRTEAESIAGKWMLEKAQGG